MRTHDAMTSATASNLRVVALRLGPGDELWAKLQEVIQREQIEAGFIMTCVGSLSQAHVRFADAPEATALQGPYEIVSLVGTIALSGSHLHIALSDAQGRTVAGHLKPGNTVHTTVELILGVITDARFTRELDPKSGYKELTITPR